MALICFELKDPDGRLQLVASFGKNTTTNNASDRFYNLPITTNQVYDVAIMYDTAHRFYSWVVNDQLECSGAMPDDWPYIGTEIIGSSGSGNGRNSQYVVDNIGWYELPKDPVLVTLLLESDGNIFTITFDGADKTYLTFSGNSDDQDILASWSPDGSKIVFTKVSSTDPSASGGVILAAGHIWTMNADGSDQRELTFGPIYGSLPSFSPDGNSILFTGSPPATRNSG